MRIMATFLLQAPVVESGEGISASQVETLLTGDEPGIMWAAWWGRMESQLLEAGCGCRRGAGEADAGGGRMRLGVCLTDGKGGLLCLLGEKGLARACWGREDKNRFAFPASVTFEGGEALMGT